MAAMNVAIIGCGVSGLTAIKCCIDGGLNPVCFEQRRTLGGVWNYTQEVRRNLASVHNCTITNTSKSMMGFSDFPMPKEFPNYLPQKLVQQYLQMYAKHFDLEKYVHFNTEVVTLQRNANPGDAGKWLISTRKLDERNSDITTKSFDAVMICNGHFWDQFTPSIPGIENFKGIMVHSGDYRTFHPYIGKRVVIVGSSHSAGDISAELSHHADQVYLTTRNGRYIISRLGKQGQPIDFLITRANMLVPKRIGLKLSSALFNNRYDFKHFGLQPTGIVARQSDQYVTVNDELFPRLITGTIAVKGDVKEITEDSVILEGGETLDNIDVLVFATGFKPSFPFAKDIIAVKEDCYVSLYEHVFLPGEDSLAVIGLTGVGGPLLPVSEMQSRVAVEVFAGRCRLPSKVVMENKIAERERRNMESGMSKSKYLQVKYVPYMDVLGEMIGVKPSLWSIFKDDPKLACQCFFGPMISAQYRLQGPNPWVGARTEIMNVQRDYRSTMSTRKYHSSAEKRSHSSIVYIMAVILAMAAIMIFAYKAD